MLSAGQRAHDPDLPIFPAISDGFPLPRLSGFTTIYRAPDRGATLDVVGVSSTIVDKFAELSTVIHRPEGAIRHPGSGGGAR